MIIPVVILIALCACEPPPVVVASCDSTPADAPGPVVARVMAVGDSLTLGGPGITGGYRSHLKAMLPDLTFVGSLENAGRHEGHNGKRIDQIRLLVLPTIDSFQPDVVLLMAGGNDITISSDVPQILAELAAFAEELRTHAPIVLVATLPFRAGDPLRHDTMLFNVEMPGAFAGASSGITVHDISSTLVYPDDFVDGAHPNDVGYAKMAVRWAQLEAL